MSARRALLTVLLLGCAIGGSWLLPGWFGRGRPFKAVAYYGPVLAGGRLWVAGADGLLRAFDPANGAALAELPLPGGAAA